MLPHPPIEGYPLELKAHNEAGPLPCVVPQMDTRAQAWWVIRRIEDLLLEGRTLSDIVILYRAHYQAMDLSRQGIPYTITSGVRFFEQAHIRDFVAQLRFAANPLDAPAFARMVMLLPKVGQVTASKLHKLLEKVATQQACSLSQAMTDPAVEGKVPAAAREDWKDLAYTLQDVELAMGGPAVGPAQRVPEEDLFASASAEVDRQRSAQKPEEIVSIAIDGWYGDYLRQVYDNWQSRKEDLDSLKGFARRYESMTDMLSQLVLLNSETSDRKIDPDSDTLSLTTVHQAKGLEFPVVVVIGMADQLFPLKRAIEEGDVEEERRLLYVAVTRAQEELYLVYPKVSAGGGPPQLLDVSRFLRELPHQTYDIIR